MHVYDLFDEALYAKMVQEGYIRQQYHPTRPLIISNYTEKATYEKAWNDVTTQCRGLIHNGDSMEVLARPFPKFFNWGEDKNLEPVRHLMTGPVRVTDKQDGSLGILYDDGQGGAIATRGSFMSDQAQHATALWKERYAEKWMREMAPHKSQAFTFTWLFEIIYPQNRIVLDYGSLDELILLDIIDVGTGASYWDLADSYCWAIGLPMTETYDYPTLLDVVGSPHRDNKEGFVVHFLDTEARVKVKHSAYVELHRIVTGLSARSIWEVTGPRGSMSIDEACLPLPDELQAWARSVHADLMDQAAVIAELARQEWMEISAEVSQVVGGPITSREYRKEFALRAVKSDRRSLLFLHLDGRTDRVIEQIWEDLKPGSDSGFLRWSEMVN